MSSGQVQDEGHARLRAFLFSPSDRVCDMDVISVHSVLAVDNLLCLVLLCPVHYPNSAHTCHFLFPFK